MSRRLQISLAAVAYIVIALALQWKAGTAKADFTLHPDESAHLVTGMMVRDYFAQHLGESPMVYAKAYYATYPKIAIGHYPPMFYIVEGAWFLLWPPSALSITVLTALLAAMVALLAFVWNPLRLNVILAWVAGALGLMLPLSINAMLPVMSDHLLTIFILLACMAWQRYCEAETRRMAILFGLAAGAAILTKASGLLLAGVPVLTLVLLRRWNWLKLPSFYIAALVTGLVGGPWTVATLHITQEGAIHTPWREYVSAAPLYYAHSLLEQTHWVIVVAAVIGLIRLRWQKMEPGTAIVLALPFLVWAFFSFVPAGWEQRYMLPALPAVTMLAVRGLRWEKGYIPMSQEVFVWFLCCLPLMLLTALSRLPTKRGSGFRQATVAALAQGTPRSVVVVSDPRGEGAVIAEAALLNPHRPSAPVIQRSTKLLGASDWLGRDYKAAISTGAQFQSLLKDNHIDLIVWDGSVPNTKLIPLLPEVHGWLQADPQHYQRLAVQPVLRDFPRTEKDGHHGTVEVWQVKP